MKPYYESDKGVAEYLLFHFGKSEDIFDFKEFQHPDFIQYPERCIRTFHQPQDECLERALDLGCAVGASTFALAQSHRQVTGIDFSASFIETANRLKESGRIDSEVPIEGDIRKPFTAVVDPDIDRSRVNFEVGDACQLRDDLGSYDTVFAGNLIDRLPSPKAFLESLPDLVKPGGQLILTSPYTWLDEYTPKEEWLSRDEPVTFTIESLKNLLTPDFALEAHQNIPFILREHSRKFQMTLAHGTAWRRK